MVKKVKQFNKKLKLFKIKSDFDYKYADQEFLNFVLNKNKINVDNSSIDNSSIKNTIDGKAKLSLIGEVYNGVSDTIKNTIKSITDGNGRLITAGLAFAASRYILKNKGGLVTNLMKYGLPSISALNGNFNTVTSGPVLVNILCDAIGY